MNWVQFQHGLSMAQFIDWVQRQRASQAEAFSSGLGAFRRVETTSDAHTVLESEGGRAAAEMDGACRGNVLLSNLKRSIGDAFYAFRQHQYACRYLAEAAYRFNRRYRLPKSCLDRCEPRFSARLPLSHFYARPPTLPAEDKR